MDQCNLSFIRYKIVYFEKQKIEIKNDVFMCREEYYLNPIQYLGLKMEAKILKKNGKTQMVLV